MAAHSKFGVFLLTISSFAGGVAVGFLLSAENGKQNRKRIADSVSEISDIIDKRGRQVLQTAEERFNHYRNTLKRELDNSVPDLYKATEHIELDEADLINGF